GAALTDPLTGAAITEVAWHPDDALPFPLCLSTRLDAEHGGSWVDGISVARGNMVLVDHGATIDDESIGSVPAESVFVTGADGTPCEPAPARPLPPRFRPWLERMPVSRVGQVRRQIEVGGRKRFVKAAFDPLQSATS